MIAHGMRPTGEPGPPMTRLGSRLVAAALVAATLGVGALGVDADDGDVFYRNKTIRILVNASGGGFDANARTLARHMGRHIPGRPAIVVDNMPGAGGLVAANHLYRVAKPDGLTIGHFSGELLLGQVLGRPGVEFDARGFEYVGVPAPGHVVCAFSRASGITSLDRWVSSPSPLKMGGTAPGSNSDNATQLLRALGLPIHVVTGYKGTAAVRLAVESGELAGACVNWGSMRSAWQHALESGQVIPVLQLAPTALPDLPGVALVGDLARTDEARKLVSTGIHRASALSRPFALPPGTPKGRVQALRQAFLATFRDPEFLADAAKARLDVDPISGEEVERLVAGLFALDASTVARLRTIFFE
jgi:tripartite-type tricarboxylate transporter receptor subunit TctC